MLTDYVNMEQMKNAIDVSQRIVRDENSFSVKRQNDGIKGYF